MVPRLRLHGGSGCAKRQCRPLMRLPVMRARISRCDCFSLPLAIVLVRRVISPCMLFLCCSLLLHRSSSSSHPLPCYDFVVWVLDFVLVHLDRSNSNWCRWPRPALSALSPEREEKRDATPAVVLGRPTHPTCTCDTNNSHSTRQYPQLSLYLVRARMGGRARAPPSLSHSS